MSVRSMVSVSLFLIKFVAVCVQRQGRLILSRLDLANYGSMTPIIEQFILKQSTNV